MPERFNREFWGHLDALLARTEVVVDRPRHTSHPEYDEMVYPLDYGYLAGTTSSDGSGIDVWVGESGQHHVVGVVCTVDLIKHDVEVKLLLGCTSHEMQQILTFLNKGDAMGAYLVRRDDSV